MSVLATILAAAAEGAGHTEPSHLPFYIAGGALAAWAVIVSVIGMTRTDFPAKPAVMRLVLAISALLVAGTISTTILTS